MGTQETDSNHYPDVDSFAAQLSTVMTLHCDVKCDTKCIQVKKLLEFSKDINPNNSAKETYDMKEIEHCWNHYVDAHIGNYKKLDCIHLEQQSDQLVLCKYLIDSYEGHNKRQIYFHRHFYHESMMKEEEDKIKHVKQTMHGQKLIDKYQQTMEVIMSSKTDIVDGVLEFGFECTKQDAKFKNPKEEILNNDFFSISARNWN